MQSKLKFIDAHGHLNFTDYDNDRDQVIERSRNLNVGMITIGTDLKSSNKAVNLAELNDDIWAVVGIHPTETNNDHDEYASQASVVIKKLANNNRVLGIGECGLDYFHSKPEDMAMQREIFNKQINIANELDKPLMLHTRSSKDGTNAYQESIEILKKTAKVGFNFHFFAGNKKDLQDILDIGGFVSFTGVITFTHDYDELIKYVPIDRVMVETDCPFVAPIPHRGKRNEPSFVIETAKAIASIRGEDEEIVRAQLLRNTIKFFHII
ncbi:MAG: TatD family hydrolase [Candidatus Paceibacterota bacterium]|jgi:TatD DNase family protein